MTEGVRLRLFLLFVFRASYLYVYFMKMLASQRSGLGARAGSSAAAGSCPLRLQQRECFGKASRGYWLPLPWPGGKLRQLS